MRVNHSIPAGECAAVFLNGKPVDPRMEVIEVDEEAGVAWAIYRDVEGRFVKEENAEPGAFIHDGIQVIQLKGKVEVKFPSLPERLTEEWLRSPEACAGFIPYKITQKGKP